MFYQLQPSKFENVKNILLTTLNIFDGISFSMSSTDFRNWL